MIRTAIAIALVVIPLNRAFIPATDDTFPKPTAAGQWAESVVTKDPFMKSAYVDGKYIWVGSTQEEYDRFNPGAFTQTVGWLGDTPSSCHEDKNGFICNQSGTMPKVSGNYLQPGTMQPLEGIPLGQTTQVIACAAITPSGKCVQINVDEAGRVIVSPDEKSDAYTTGYQKGYMMGFKNGSETK